MKEDQQLPDDCFNVIKEQIGEKTDVILHFLVGLKHEHQAFRQFCIDGGYRFKSWSYSPGGGSKTGKNVLSPKRRAPKKMVREEDKTPKYLNKRARNTISAQKSRLKRSMIINLIEASLAMATKNDEDVPELTKELHRLKNKK